MVQCNDYNTCSKIHSHKWENIHKSHKFYVACACMKVPVGRIMNSCMASLLPAWLPPLITLNAGTGRMTSLFPARSAI